MTSGVEHLIEKVRLEKLDKLVAAGGRPRRKRKTKPKTRAQVITAANKLYEQLKGK